MGSCYSLYSATVTAFPALEGNDVRPSSFVQHGTAATMTMTYGQAKEEIVLAVSVPEPSEQQQQQQQHMSRRNANQVPNPNLTKKSVPRPGLQIQPRAGTELVFSLSSVAASSKASMILWHPGGSCRASIAYKVLTTQPDRYLVSPSQGILGPGASEALEVTLAPRHHAALLRSFQLHGLSGLEEWNSGLDLFCIVSAPVSDTFAMQYAKPLLLQQQQQEQNKGVKSWATSRRHHKNKMKNAAQNQSFNMASVVDPVVVNTTASDILHNEEKLSQLWQYVLSRSAESWALQDCKDKSVDSCPYEKHLFKARHLLLEAMTVPEPAVPPNMSIVSPPPQQQEEDTDTIVHLAQAHTEDQQRQLASCAESYQNDERVYNIRTQTQYEYESMHGGKGAGQQQQPVVEFDTGMGDDTSCSSTRLSDFKDTMQWYAMSEQSSSCYSFLERSMSDIGSMALSSEYESVAQQPMIDDEDENDSMHNNTVEDEGHASTAGATQDRLCQEQHQQLLHVYSSSSSSWEKPSSTPDDFNHAHQNLQHYYVTFKKVGGGMPAVVDTSCELTAADTSSDSSS